jgi:hypothetical protein
MISEEKLPEYIGREIPELSSVCDKAHCANIYDVVGKLLDYTRDKLTEHNTHAARQCMMLTEKLYNKGNQTIKNAIENVFVFSFSHAFFHDEDKRQEIMSIVPDTLYKLYRDQLINSHL